MVPRTVHPSRDDTVGSSVVMVPEDVEAVTQPDGTTTIVRHWRSSQPALARVVVLHGLGEHSGRYARTGSILANMGLDVQAPDLRGFGASSGPRGRVTRIDDWLDDAARIIEGIRSAKDGRAIALLGHSMGGLLATLYAESERPAPDLMVLDAPAIATRRSRVERLSLHAAAVFVPDREMKGRFDGALLSRDSSVGVAFEGDPLNHLPLAFRLADQLLSAQRIARRNLDHLTLPTLVTHGEDDPIVPVDVSRLLLQLPNVERRVYPGLRHETFNEPEGPEVVADIGRWMIARLPSR